MAGISIQPISPLRMRCAFDQVAALGSQRCVFRQRASARGAAGAFCQRRHDQVWLAVRVDNRSGKYTARRGLVTRIQEGNARLVYIQGPLA
jgi:hypothetical protein